MKRLLRDRRGRRGARHAMASAPAMAEPSTSACRCRAPSTCSWSRSGRHAGARPRAIGDVNLQFEDAQGDVGRQLNQVQNFVAQGVDAIIVNAADTSATQGITDMAAAGRHPAGLRQSGPGARDAAAREGRGGGVRPRGLGPAARWKAWPSAWTARATSPSCWASSPATPPTSAPPATRRSSPSTRTSRWSWSRPPTTSAIRRST